MKAKFILIVGLLVMTLFTGKVTGQSSIGSVIFINNGPGYPAQNQVNYSQSNVGGGNGGAIMPFIPTGTSTWTVSRLGSDPPNNSGFWSINQFFGDYLTLTFPCGGSASFTLNGGSCNVVLNSSGCFDAAATYLANPQTFKPPTLDNGLDTGPEGKPDDCGMPVWDVTEPFISLWLNDEPLGYQPAVGPRISFELRYNQGEPAKSDGTGWGNWFATNCSSVGKQWNCSWLSVVSGATLSPTLYFAGGGRQFFQLGGSASNPINPTYTQLSSWPDFPYNCATNFLVLSYPDGSQHYYLSVTNAGGLWIAGFLAQIVNPQGQKILFNYSSYNPSAPVLLLQSVVDGDGRTNRIYYDLNNYLITRVVDPFGRTNYLRYNANGDLTNITDVAANSSSLGYATNDVVTSLVTPYGTTTFAPANGTNSVIPNGRSLLVTRPDNSHELFLYTDSAAGVAGSYATLPNISPFTEVFDNIALDHCKIGRAHV